MRRSASISGLDPSAQVALSSEVAEREAALTEQLAAAEARAASAAAEREAIKVRLRTYASVVRCLSMMRLTSERLLALRLCSASAGIK